MIYFIEPQSIENLKLFLRLTLPMDDLAFLLFGRGISDDEKTVAKAREGLLKFADQLQELTAPRLSNTWLNYEMGGLDLPHAQKLDKLNRQDKKFFKTSG